MNLSEDSLKRGYEVRDASARAIVIAAALVVAGVAASLGVVAWMLHAQPGATAASPSLNPVLSFRHGPEARTSIQKSWAEIEPRTRARLEGYRWIDREVGRVQIPVERAMELIVEERAGEEVAR